MGHHYVKMCCIPPKVAWCFDAPRFVCQIPSNSLVKRSQWGRCLWLQSAKWLSLVIRSSDLVSRLHELQIDRQIDLLLLLITIIIIISYLSIHLVHLVKSIVLLFPSYSINYFANQIPGFPIRSFQGRWRGVQELLLQHDGGVQYRWESQGPEMSWFFWGLSRCEKLVT